MKRYPAPDASGLGRSDDTPAPTTDRSVDVTRWVPADNAFMEFVSSVVPAVVGRRS
jgi:hypothetical protein